MAPLPEDLKKLKWYGDFPMMERVIQKRLSRDIPQALKERLLAELEIIRRLPGQYPYSWDEAFAVMAENIRDFSREEFQALWEEDAMEWIYIQGRVCFHHLFFSNLIKTREWMCSRLLYPELAAGKSENSDFLNQVIAVMKEEGKISRRFRVQTTMCLKESAQRSGEEIRVYLPVPVEYAQVKDFALLHARVAMDGNWKDVPVFRLSPEDTGEGICTGDEERTKTIDGRSGRKSTEYAKSDENFTAWIAPEHAPQRTVCFCGKYQKDTRFRVEYLYQVDMPYVDLYSSDEQKSSEAYSSDGQKSLEAYSSDGQKSPEAYFSYRQRNPEAYSFNGQKNPKKALPHGWFPEAREDFPEYFLQEQLPHIHFTPYLRALAEEIVGKETRPLEKARKIYDYLTTHVMYSFVRDYFSITELVDYTASGWKGDCGLQALMFITLCRIAKIPARWQSGLYTRPADPGSHDWAMFYLEEYGWLFADCSFGGSAARMGCEERRRFYFGNLDPYRMPSCCQFQADFLPPMKGWRFDPYDNQSGEAEYPDRCLHTEETETEHKVQEILPE